MGRVPLAAELDQAVRGGEAADAAADDRDARHALGRRSLRRTWRADDAPRACG